MAEPNESLDALQHKIDAAKARTGVKEQGSAAPHGDIGQAMRLSVDLVAGVLVGGVFGFFADRWLGTMPLFFIVCLLLGAAAGFRNMLRDAKTMSDKTET